MTEPTVSAQTRTATPEEDIKKLYARTAELSDRVAALFSPAWGASAGILPADHPLHPGVAEQRSAVDWQDIAKRRERELKQVGVARHEAEQERDGAYRERAHLVALLTAMTPGAVITYATDVDEPGWQIVYLNLGGHQASWHISPRDADLFQHVERVEHDDPRGHWDGHTTEEKYAGIAAWTAELMRRCGQECAEMHTGAGRCETAQGPA